MQHIIREMKILGGVLLLLLGNVKSEGELHTMTCIPGSVVNYDTARCFCNSEGQITGCESFYAPYRHSITRSMEVLNKPCIPGQLVQNKTTRCLCSPENKLKLCTQLFQMSLPQIRSDIEDDDSCIPGTTVLGKTTKCTCGPEGELINCINVTKHKISVKIVGGVEALRADGAFVVSLFNEPRRQHFCGGSIIDDFWVITAAHCVDRVQSDVYIRAGSTVWHEGGHIFKGVKVIKNSGFSWDRFDYDIALIKVDKPLLSSNIGLAKIQLAPLGTISPPTSTKMTVLGWGRTLEHGPVSNILLKVTVPTVSSDECKQKYGAFVTVRMLCAGYKSGKLDACKADSGGPLVQNNTLWGIVSFGDGCARKYTPGVYTRVTNLRCWIHCNTGL